MRKLFLLPILLFWNGLSYSQDEKKDRLTREEIETQKVAFISSELSLTTKESGEFWPVYNAYNEKIRTVHKERKKYMKELRKIDDLSDQRAYELSELIFKTHTKETDVRLDYLKQFAVILGKKKAAKVFMAEERFKRVLLKRLKGDGPRHEGPPR